jgi:hypothetical protein
VKRSPLLVLFWFFATVAYLLGVFWLIAGDSLMLLLLGIFFILPTWLWWGVSLLKAARSQRWLWFGAHFPLLPIAPVVTSVYCIDNAPVDASSQAAARR